MPQPPDDEPKGPPRPESEAEESVDPLLLEAAKALDPTAPAPPPHGREGTSRDPDQGALALAVGTLIAGRYRLDYRLGEGGMGEVWAATHAITRRSVAMKFLKASMSLRSDMRQRFLREARAVSLVQHPSVVEVLDVFELEDGMPVM